MASGAFGEKVWYFWLVVSDSSMASVRTFRLKNCVRYPPMLSISSGAHSLAL